MKTIASSPDTAFALIGDLVGSRRHASRAEVQAALRGALDEANAMVPALQPLEPTIGDEFQGAYVDLASAAFAALVVRLALPDGLDSRVGIGVGTIEVVGTSRYGLTQDGPAWWSARDAVVHVKQMERRVPDLRTLLGPVEHASGQEDSWVNAYLVSRDAVVARLDTRQRRLALGLMRGRTRRDLAEAEGISPSAVSQSLRRSGAASLVETVRMLGT